MMRTLLLVGFACCLSVGSLAAAGTPSVEQALKLRPVQKDVTYDQPSPEEIKDCTIAVEKEGNSSGWVVKNPEGQILRRFSDTDGDNVVDHWSYYLDGVEVYRDVDADGNGKADQYRWLGSQGIRWGQDTDGDHKLDNWKMISAEEVSAEVVGALAEKDVARFERVLLSKQELDELGLGKKLYEKLAEQIKTLPEEFKQRMNAKNSLGSDARWLRFDAVRPSLFPAGTNQATKDVILYENAGVVVETASGPQMVQIGTLIKVGDAWRVIELPQALDDEPTELAGGMFFRPASVRNENHSTSSGGSEAYQKHLVALEKLDTAQNSGKGLSELEYNKRRADILENLFRTASTTEERIQWGKQFADTISIATQSGEYPEGADRLDKFNESFAGNKDLKPLLAYSEFRFIMADYGASMQNPNADFAKIQTQFLERLEGFVSKHPESEDAAEAMLQLGVTQELSGQEEEAQQWYAKVANDYPESEHADKAKGAYRRLNSVGQAIEIAGESVSGKQVSLAAYRGKIVAVDYWASWCQPCVEGFDDLKALQQKYGNKFAVLSINLDSDQSTAAQYTKQHRLPWEVLHTPGGLNSRLANEMGILTLPTMLLIDEKGRVINRTLHVSQLEAELKKLLK